MAAVLVDLDELKAALGGTGSSLYGDDAYQRVADTAEDVIMAHLLADTPADYVAVAPVRTVALLLAVELWQARSSAAGGSVGIDLNPYRLGRTLVSRYHGVLVNYLAVGGMVG